MQISLEANMIEGKPMNSTQKNFVSMIRKAFKNYKVELEDLKLFRYEHKNFRDHYELEDDEIDLKEKEIKNIKSTKKRKVKFHIENLIKIVTQTNYENVKQFKHKLNRVLESKNYISEMQHNAVDIFRKYHTSEVRYREFKEFIYGAL